MQQHKCLPTHRWSMLIYLQLFIYLFIFNPLFQDSTGRVRAVDGELVIDEVVPSDGGLYSCMAVSTSGNASRDVAIHSKSFVLTEIKES